MVNKLLNIKQKVLRIKLNYDALSVDIQYLNHSTGLKLNIAIMMNDGSGYFEDTTNINHGSNNNQVSETAIGNFNGDTKPLFAKMSSYFE